jgi:hypothetical protein
MPVLDYATFDPSRRIKWRARLTAVAACVSICICLFISFPAFDTKQWLERARHYNLDKALIAQVEQGQRRNIKLAVVAWSVAGAGWAMYLGIRRHRQPT